MSFAAKGKNKEKKLSLQIQDKQAPHTLPQKTISENDHRSLKFYVLQCDVSYSVLSSFDAWGLI